GDDGGRGWRAVAIAVPAAVTIITPKSRKIIITGCSRPRHSSPARSGVPGHAWVGSVLSAGRAAVTGPGVTNPRAPGKRTGAVWPRPPWEDAQRPRWGESYAAMSANPKSPKLPRTKSFGCKSPFPGAAFSTVSRGEKGLM